QGPQQVGIRRNVRSAINGVDREPCSRRLADEAPTRTGISVCQRADIQDPLSGYVSAKEPISTGGSMKLMWIVALILLFASLASLVTCQHSGQLIEESWAGSTNVLSDGKLNELQRAIPAYASRVFLIVPEPLRQRFAAKTWKAIELITFRLLVLLHVAPALLIPVLVGFLEGSW